MPSISPVKRGMAQAISPSGDTTCVFMFSSGDLICLCSTSSVQQHSSSSTSGNPALCTSAANSLALCSLESLLATLTTSATVSNRSSSFHLQNGLSPPSPAVVKSINYLAHYSLTHLLCLNIVPNISSEELQITL